jgi:hypothetical protein
LHGAADPALDLFDDVVAIASVPAPIERLGGEAELHDEIAGEVLRLGLAPFFAPEADEGALIIAHDDPGI